MCRKTLLARSQQPTVKAAPDALCEKVCMLFDGFKASGKSRRHANSSFTAQTHLT